MADAFSFAATWEFRLMSRFIAGMVAGVLAIALATTFAGSAAAAPPGKRGGPAARSAPAAAAHAAPRISAPPRMSAPAKMAIPRMATPHISAPVRAAPQMAAPSRAPRIAAPATRHIQPAGRAAMRIERHHRQAGALRHRAAPSEPRTVGTVDGGQRLQQLQSRGRLSRSQRHELRALQRVERQNARRIDRQPADAQTAKQDRLQQLQSRRRLSRSERRELRRLQADERRNVRQEQQQPQQQQPATAAASNRQPRPMRTHAVSPQQAAAGRFASGVRPSVANGHPRLAGRRAARLASRTAWQLGLLAPYIPWRGPVYWPYAYNDVFYYTFWPDAYDPGYWDYAYDDFFDGLFFPDGAPYARYAAEGPYSSPDGRTTTGSAPSHVAAPGRMTAAMREFCADQAKGVTAWPFAEITEAVQPNEDQKALIENLRKASEEAAAKFGDSCPDAVPMTPPGRLQAILLRLKATDEAIKIVKPALTAFYDSLNDEQKARFNEIGVQLGQPRQQSASRTQRQANCSGEKIGLSGLAINRVEEAVRPSETQGAALDRLDEAIQKAVQTLEAACPDATPLTPVGRLDTMQQRLEAMIDAANTVRPALEEFYASLNDEQKAKLNRLGRETAHSAD